MRRLVWCLFALAVLGVFVANGGVEAFGRFLAWWSTIPTITQANLLIWCAYGVMVVMVVADAVRVVWNRLTSSSPAALSGVARVEPDDTDGEGGVPLSIRAAHEAAHAVVATVMGLTVTHVDVKCVLERTGQTRLAAQPDGMSNLEFGWALMVLDVAGNQAEHSHGCHFASSSTDMRMALEHAAEIISIGVPPADLHDMPLTFDTLFATARTTASRILNNHHDTVDRLTDALTTRKSLESDDLDGLLDGCRPLPSPIGDPS